MNDEQRENDARLRKRLALLKDKLAAGKIEFSPGLRAQDDLLAVRTGPDGEIDLSTVSGGVRALALAAEAMLGREETKSIISLQDLQRGYFEFVEANFGRMYHDMHKHGATPFQFASALAEDVDAVRDLHKAVPELLSWVKALWKEAGDVAQIHAEDTAGLKAIFGGETFPQGNKNVVSSTGVYVDTVVLPDPFLRTEFLLNGANQASAVRAMANGALSLLNYKEAAITDLDTPLAAIVPDKIFLDENYRRFVFDIADGDAAAHLATLFGVKFASLEEAESFLAALKTPSDVAGRVADPSRLLFDVDETGTIEARLAKFMEKQLPGFGFEIEHAGDAVMLSAVSRMRQANDLLFRSRVLSGIPLIDAPTSWRYFNWKLGDAGEGHTAEARLGMHMTKALQSAADGEMQWLGSVPLAALIEMRKAGALPELRAMLAEGVKELMELRPNNFYRTGDKVTENIQRAFDIHSKKLAALTGKKWQFAGVELASCVVKGVVQIASACGVPGVSLVGAALDQAVDVPKIKELPQRVRELRNESRDLNGCAVGMLFKLANR